MWFYENALSMFGEYVEIVGEDSDEPEEEEICGECGSDFSLYGCSFESCQYEDDQDTEPCYECGAEANEPCEENCPNLH